MAAEENGSHFGASSANMQQLEEFSIEETAQTMKSNAPGLWGLLGTLLGKDERLGSNEDVVMSDAEEAVDDYYWDQVEAIELEGFINALTSEGDTVASKRDIHTNRCAAICNIKKVVILSIMMQSTNRKSNALQSIIGIFLQSMHTPQNVVDTLAHIGISISTDAIHAAVKSMSAESQNVMRELGQSLLASYAYDNFDVDLKSHLPVVEKSNDSLKHLTSGLMFPLRHGITIDDLNCSEELWRQSALNTQAIEQDLPPRRTWKDLLSIHSESEVTRNLTRHDRFNAWLFLMDLCTHGPEYFHLFKSEIPPPEVIEEIPLHKTSITAARAMDINNSTNF
ncbi:hypothetical protein CY34DRAFT_110984 [Suillus luteus UH-Slu-Lm8-n1]|uniref:Unplaced genomic scaffold CY34scaffold_1133, whole genome shotgun sequence n=1 Tax=Suillus luteus UH-Slu-Lm8-n1 TaxID=930992 RepID=A0A0D0AKE4_9AGAM|nr:hypothetical protein CY34DRAFT_110984 [Suillus luteus UH-Slu-Lm8-n1]